MGDYLGGGGQGEVYRLESRLGQPAAAIKFLKSGAGQTDYDSERFRREISVLSQLDHPNVMQIVEFNLEPEPYYVMATGQPLDKYWPTVRAAASESLFDVSSAIILALLEGIAAIHERGLVHRDIKPANVIQLLDGRFVLSDFGIVHVPDDERITVRPAGNRFAPHVSSLYDPRSVSKAADTVGLVKLWAWLLAKDPSTALGHYHWRFHEFVDDPRCEIVRTLLALCSEPATWPKDATALKARINDRYAITSPGSTIEGPAIVRIRQAQATTRAKGDLDEQTVRTELAVTVRAVTPLLSPILSTLRDQVQSLRSGGVLTVEYHGPDADTAAAEDRMLMMILASRSHGTQAQFATVKFADDACEEFGVTVYVQWHASPHEDKSKFSIQFQQYHHGIPEIHLLNSQWAAVQTDGTVPELDVHAVISRITEFMADERNWMPKRMGVDRSPPAGYLA